MDTQLPPVPITRDGPRAAALSGPVPHSAGAVVIPPAVHATAASAPGPAGHELPELHELLEWSRAHGSPMGYFAALYFHTGRALEQGLARGWFRNPGVLSSVNDTFFDRYLAAFQAARTGVPTSSSWAAAFTAAQDEDLTVLQHLMLGMNAHINFDLAVAVSDALPPAALDDFHSDFQTMNRIFSGLVQDMAADLAVVWRPLRIVNRLLRREDQACVNCCLLLVRDEAWHNVLRLSRLEGIAREQAIAELDERTTKIAHLMRRPGWPGTALARLVRRDEHGDVAQVIDDLLQR